MDPSPAPTLPALLLETYHESHPQAPIPDLFNKQSTEYLTRLTGYSLNSLTSEPSRIADEHAFVGRELTSLCVGEYKSFVAVHQCKEHVKGALDEFDASLEELRRAIPELERECASFVQETSGIQSARRRAQIVLEHQDKLEDLLDIPQLVDTCVRNGYYHEAMELTSHTRQLVSHYPDVPLVHSISAQVDSIMQLQLSQLVASLREPVKLPVLVKSIGFLRKMGSLEEDELRLAFLESRAQRWRDHVKEHVDKERSEPTRYVRRYVDAFRELQYDTIVQYTAIFLDPTPFRNQTTRKTNADATGMDEASRVQALDLIVRYAHHAVSDLLLCITSYVPFIADPSSLASLLTQLGYTALSFSRVGMDFSAYLPEVFENAVLGLTTTGLDNGLKVVLDRLRPVSTSQKSASPSGRLDIESVFVPGFLVSPEMLQTMTRSEPPEFNAPIHSHPESKTIPPLYLSSYPILATYTNSILTTLNSLRLLAPVALFPSLCSYLLDNLANLGQALLDYANHSTGQSDPAFGPVSRKRPEGLRRNTSISNRDQLAERTETRERHGRRVLSAVLDAFVNGCAEFLKMALVEGVYDGQFGSVDEVKTGGAGDIKSKNDRLTVVNNLIKDWVARHAEKTSSKDTQESRVIHEEETAAENTATTVSSGDKANDNLPEGPLPTTDQVPAIQSDVPAEPEEAVGYKFQPTEPEVTEHTLVGTDASREVHANTSPSEQETQSSDRKEIHRKAEDPLLDSADSKVDATPVPPLPDKSGLGDDSLHGSAEGTAAIQQTSGPHVIERVLEVQLENSETDLPEEVPKQGLSELSRVADPIPVQITEDVQVPLTDSELSNVDNAVPVAVVPGTSEDTARVQENGVPSTRANDSQGDELDQLIAAKEAVESAKESNREETEQNEMLVEDAARDVAPTELEVPSESEAVGSAPPLLSNVTVNDTSSTVDVGLAAHATARSDDTASKRNVGQRPEQAPLSEEAGESIEAESTPLSDAEKPTSIEVTPAMESPNQTPATSPDGPQELQPSGPEDPPSGIATPEEEAEVEEGTQPDAIPASTDAGNVNNAKSKKKKNKKKGKK